MQPPLQSAPNTNAASTQWPNVEWALMGYTARDSVGQHWPKLLLNSPRGKVPLRGRKRNTRRGAGGRGLRVARVSGRTAQAAEVTVVQDPSPLGHSVHHVTVLGRDCAA